MTLFLGARGFATTPLPQAPGIASVVVVVVVVVVNVRLLHRERDPTQHQNGRFGQRLNKPTQFVNVIKVSKVHFAFRVFFLTRLEIT